MEVLSVIGIILGVAVFVFLSFKRVNMFIGTIAASLVVAILSGMNPITAILDTYNTGFAGFISSWFLVFCMSAVFGRVMEDSGCARKIGLSLANLTKRSKKNAKFLSVLILPLFYFFLSYSGINGFVVVFTVLAIGRELFHEVDAPWILYPYGSAGIMPAIMLGGSLYITNLMSAEGFGTPLTSMMGLSIVCAIVCAVVMVIMLYFDLKKFERRGEGFLPSGAEIMKVQIGNARPMEELPNLVISFICLFAPVVSILLFDLEPVLGLLIGTILCVILNFKKFDNLLTTLSGGVTSSAAPIVNVCAAVGFGAVIKVTSGFTLIYDLIDKLPDLYGGILLSLIFCSVIGSSSTHLPVVLPDIVEKFAAAGLSAEMGHRLTTLSVFTYMVPHNSGPVNAITLSRINFAQAAWIYFKTAALPGFCALVVALVAMRLGIVG